jgi:hypothetical protein
MQMLKLPDARRQTVNQPSKPTPWAIDHSCLTTIQASVRTGIPKTTLARWRRDGRGPIFVKRGGRPLNIRHGSLKSGWRPGGQSRTRRKCGDLGNWKCARRDRSQRTMLGAPEAVGRMDGGHRLAKLFDEDPVAVKNSESSLASFEEQIRLAKAAETGLPRVSADTLTC